MAITKLVTVDCEDRQQRYKNLKNWKNVKSNLNFINSQKNKKNRKHFTSSKKTASLSLPWCCCVYLSVTGDIY